MRGLEARRWYVRRMKTLGWMGLVALLVPAAARAAGGPLYVADEAKLTAVGGAAGDHFGYAVAAAPDTVLVGAYDKGGLGGAAYVYARSGTKWSEQALTPSGLLGKDAFGSSVALSESGDTAAVGAPGQGAVFVFVRSGTSWVQQGRLSVTDGAAERFGFSVALSNNTLVVGAPERAGKAGGAYVFLRSGTLWGQQAAITGKTAGDRFGWAVAVSGDTALVGAPFIDVAIGRVFVFARSGGTWTEGPKLSAVGGDEVTGAGFGVSLALEGDTAVVGANGMGGETGAAYVMVRSGSTFTHQSKLLAPDGKAGDNFGAVALCKDTVVVGAFHRGGNTGAAYTFTRKGTAWSALPVMVAADGAKGDLLGEGVACAGDTVVAGADGASAARGAVYVARVSATKPASAACARGVECASGYCADGACCAKECAGAVCATDPDCPAGYTCVGAKCVQNTAGAACSEDKTRSISTSGTTNCSPYVCVDSPGTCLDKCTTSTQCAAGFVCDGPSSKCVPSAPASAGDGGCAVAAPQTQAGLAWIFVGCGGLGLVARRRRRR